MRRTGPTNIVLRKTIRTLKKAANQHNAPIWDAVAEKLSAPRRRRVAVNLSKINRHTSEGDTVVVPGKVLAAGSLNHPVTVAAVAFSQKAVEKIQVAGGRVIHILQLVEENPRGSGVKVIT